MGGCVRYRFPLDQGNQTVYECLKNWMDDYNRRIMTTTFMISEEKEQIKFFSDRLMQAYELYVDNRYHKTIQYSNFTCQNCRPLAACVRF